MSSSPTEAFDSKHVPVKNFNCFSSWESKNDSLFLKPQICNYVLQINIPICQLIEAVFSTDPVPSLNYILSIFKLLKQTAKGFVWEGTEYPTNASLAQNLHFGVCIRETSYLKSHVNISTSLGQDYELRTFL